MDRSVIGSLLEEQVRHLTAERDRLLQEHQANLKLQLEEYQESLNYLAIERVEHQREKNEVEAELEEIYDKHSELFELV